MDLYCCDECGQTYALDHNGVSYHVDVDGMQDHDKDADHVAYGEEYVTEPNEKVEGLT
jgi:hypothetical protein